MVAGAEIGFDAPAVAVNLRVFSDIFLRLIKTIVAPLILATLVTGIAGHGDLKGVGPAMGIKSLIYFEVVTTLALVIGLAAINLSHAGVGLSLASSTSAPEGVTAPAPTRWQDFLLHVFPENIAKSSPRVRFCRSPSLPSSSASRSPRWTRKNALPYSASSKACLR